MSQTIGVLGCGWLGLPLAKAFLNDGHRVLGSTTSAEKLDDLSTVGIEPYLISIKEDQIEGPLEEFLDEIDILVVNVPPKMRGDNYESYYKKMKTLQQTIPKSKTINILFVSSTSVYGETKGTITENTKPIPTSRPGKELLLSEKMFTDPHKKDASVVRFGGLIGGNRHPINQLTGRTGLKNGNDPVNLIHREDCIRLISYIIDNKLWGEVFNGVYPEHPLKKDYYISQAKKRGLKPPVYDEFEGAKNAKFIKSKYFLNKSEVFKTDIN